jgi:hypothetical protein
VVKVASGVPIEDIQAETAVAGLAAYDLEDTEAEEELASVCLRELDV